LDLGEVLEGRVKEPAKGDPGDEEAGLRPPGFAGTQPHEWPHIRKLRMNGMEVCIHEPG
jgi:hypothetical protein